ncbi:MAG: GTPase [Clostridia bacterium]|nr:GTPase [Clostridia bacterium]
MDQIPVYLFLGFLESGKTKFVQETMEDTRFNDGESTVILMCEEGIEEYDVSTMPKGDVRLITVENESELTPEFLSDIDKKYKPMRVMCEYNGMWLTKTLLDNMPERWALAQTFVFADATTFINYNANMRSLVVDKLSLADLVAFNRYRDDCDMEMFHKIVRATSRRCEIVYEFADGKVVPDEIEDPLPFDLDADVVEIDDRDYAIWYRDLCDEMNKYDGKTIRYKVYAVKNKNLPDGLVLGRDMMTCCVQDIRYAGIACRNPQGFAFEEKGWYIAQGKIGIRFSKAYGKKGPVMEITSLEKCGQPDEPVATFY